MKPDQHRTWLGVRKSARQDDGDVSIGWGNSKFHIPKWGGTVLVCAMAAWTLVSIVRIVWGDGRSVPIRGITGAPYHHSMTNEAVRPR